MIPSAHFTQFQLSFAATDASGRMHFSHVFPHVEEAEHLLLQSLGVPIHNPLLGGWPRIHVDCQYHAPVFFQDTITQMLKLKKIGDSSLNWYFEWKNHHSHLVVSGNMICVRVDAEGKKISIPDSERQLLLSLYHAE